MCGKLIVASTKEELPRLDALYQRGIANGVQVLDLFSALSKRQASTSNVFRQDAAARLGERPNLIETDFCVS